MTDILGFTALGLALFALSKDNILALRWWHLLSSCLYVIYGVTIAALPVIVGAVLYCGIHSWHIYKYSQAKKYKVR